MDYFKLLVTLPHHSQMGMFQNDRTVPVWEAAHGSKWSVDDLMACSDLLIDRVAANKGVEWGDVRARAIDSDQALFLRRAVELRARDAADRGK